MYEIFSGENGVFFWRYAKWIGGPSKSFDLKNRSFGENRKSSLNFCFDGPAENLHSGLSRLSPLRPGGPLHGATLAVGRRDTKDVRHQYPHASERVAETPAIVSVVASKANCDRMSPRTDRRSIDDHMQ